jgi:hypothetical protein
MTGSKQTPQAPVPTAFKVRKQSRVMEVSFDDGAEFSLPFELLRVYSPSAEVRGHGIGQEVLQLGKREVEIVAVEPVGNYGVKPATTAASILGPIYTGSAPIRARCGSSICAIWKRQAIPATQDAIPRRRRLRQNPARPAATKPEAIGTRVAKLAGCTRGRLV